MENVNTKANRSRGVAELAFLFLKLGCTAFGGPAAHIGMMENEVVRRRKWLTHDEFLDLLGATNLIPGPNSTEMAIHIGHRRAGWLGLVVAGACFILPAAVIVGALAWAYVGFGQLPEVDAFLYGVKPVIIAIVVQALWGLSKTAVKKSWMLGAVACGAAVLNLFGLNELIVLFGAGAFVALVRGGLAWKLNAIAFIPFSAPAASAAGAATVAPFSLSAMFLFFLKVGSVLFGSGYVLLAFLRADLVERWGWLTQQQLLDAIAVGQFTPGPVFTAATFIGYVLGGISGAVLATLGIFLPAFFFVAISGPLIPRIRRSKPAGAFLDGVNAASLALMGVVTLQLGRAAVVDWQSGIVAVLAGLLLVRYKVNSAWLVFGGAVIGFLLHVPSR